MRMHSAHGSSSIRILLTSALDLSGAAVASIEAVYLQLSLPSATVSLRAMGLPRVGNAAWAAWFSTIVKDAQHVSNQNGMSPRTFRIKRRVLMPDRVPLSASPSQDPVPRLPLVPMGFSQVSSTSDLVPMFSSILLMPIPRSLQIAGEVMLLPSLAPSYSK